MKLPLVSALPGLGGWSEDPLWAGVYDWIVEHPRLGGAVWALGTQSDLRRLYRAADEIGRLPAGSRVLDVPCGGGVALRGLRPGQGVSYLAVDIAQPMLDRTSVRARERGLDDQLTTRLADVGDLPLDDGSIDLVVSLTGLHCFPEPARAVVEMCRVLRPGGVLVASTLLLDSGLRFAPMRQAGRLAGLLGPGLTGRDLEFWLAARQMVDVELVRSGAFGYVRAVRGD